MCTVTAAVPATDKSACLQVCFLPDSGDSVHHWTGSDWSHHSPDALHDGWLHGRQPGSYNLLHQPDL